MLRYEQQTSSPSLTTRPQAKADVQTDIIGAAVTKLGGAVASYAHNLDVMENKDAVATVSKEMSDFNLRQLEKFETAKTSDKVDGFTGDILKEYDNETQKTYERIKQEKGEKAANLFKDRAYTARDNYGTKALYHERDQKINLRYRQVGEGAEADKQVIFKDPTQHDSLLNNKLTEVDLLELPPAKRDELKSDLKRQYALAREQKSAKDDPIGTKTAIVGGGNDYFNKLIGKESGFKAGIKNPNSTAIGYGQFIEETWKGLMKKYPDAGLTLDGRTNPQQSMTALKLFTQENEQILKSKNIPVNDKNLYMTHFLGQGGGPIFLKMLEQNPNALVTAAGIGEKEIKANKSVFLNSSGELRTVGQVYTMMTHKFSGDKTFDGKIEANPRFASLTFSDTQTLMNVADRNIAEQQQQYRVGLQSNVEKSLYNAKANGTAPTLGYDDFARAYGDVEGFDKFEEYQTTAMVEANAHKFKNADLQTIEQMLIDQKKVMESSPDIDNQKRFNHMTEAAKREIQARETAPAQYVMQNSDAAKAAAKQYQTAVDNPNMSNEDKGSYARLYADTLIREQQRIGVPEDKIQIFQKDIALKMVNDLQGSEADAPQKMVDNVNSMIRTWGADNFRRIISTVGADVNPHLLSMAEMSMNGQGQGTITLAKALKNGSKAFSFMTEQDVNKVKGLVTTELSETADTFRHINNGATSMNRYAETATLMAKQYMFDGLSQSDAVKKASGQVIKDSYVFTDIRGETVRIPKTARVDEYTATAAGNEYIKKIDYTTKFEVVDGMRRKKAEELDIDNIKRQGAFITDPREERGLVLVDGNRRTVTRDGEPVILKWEDMNPANRIQYSKDGKAPIIANESIANRQAMEDIASSQAVQRAAKGIALPYDKPRGK